MLNRIALQQELDATLKGMPTLDRHISTIETLLKDDVNDDYAYTLRRLMHDLQDQRTAAQKNIDFIKSKIGDEFQAYCQTCDPRYSEKVLHRGTMDDCLAEADKHRKNYTHLVAVFAN